MSEKTTGLIVLGGVAAFFAWAARGTPYRPPPIEPPVRREKKALPQPKGMTLEELQVLMKREGDSAEIKCPTDSGPLRCYVRRQPSTKTLNAYVKIPNSLADRIVAMHGGRYLNAERLTGFGITYGGSCKAMGLGDGYCAGIDTNSGDDFVPGRLDSNRGGETYKDMEFVKDRIRKISKEFLPGGKVYSKGIGVEGKQWTRGPREFTEEERQAAYRRAKDPYGYGDY